jgi:hypothetical protein
LLEDRSAETLAAWLKQYLELNITIEHGAPRAVEVMDRWHRLKNLRQSSERLEWRATT